MVCRNEILGDLEAVALGGFLGFHLRYRIHGVIWLLSGRTSSVAYTFHESGMVHMMSQSDVWSVGMKMDDGSNPKWRRTGYSSWRIFDLFRVLVLRNGFYGSMVRVCGISVLGFVKARSDQGAHCRY